MNMHYLNCGLIVIITFSVWSGESCFIIDCPFADKFAGRDYDAEIPRKCPSCWHKGLGECVASNICCVPGIGCAVGESEITRPCLHEARIGLKCSSSSSSSCSLWDSDTNKKLPGVCTMDGLCCATGTCRPKLECINKMKDEPIVRSRRHLVMNAFRKSLDGHRRFVKTFSGRPNGTTGYVLPDLDEISYHKNDFRRT